jgi:hypothetical protein
LDGSRRAASKPVLQGIAKKLGLPSGGNRAEMAQAIFEKLEANLSLIRPQGSFQPGSSEIWAVSLHSRYVVISYTIKCGPKVDIVAKNDVHGFTGNNGPSPAIAHGRIYVRDAEPAIPRPYSISSARNEPVAPTARPRYRCPQRRAEQLGAPVRQSGTAPCASRPDPIT